MAADPPVVIDTNILFSALLAANGRIHHTLFRSGYQFRICETALVELFETRSASFAAPASRPKRSWECTIGFSGASRCSRKS